MQQESWLLFLCFCSVCLWQDAAAAKKKGSGHPAGSEDQHHTWSKSPAPEPDKMDQKAVVKNGNITMVNEYLVNGNKTDDKETDSRTGENSENAESPEPETDNGSDTGDQEDIIEE